MKRILKTIQPNGQNAMSDRQTGRDVKLLPLLQQDCHKYLSVYLYWLYIIKKKKVCIEVFVFHNIAEKAQTFIFSNSLSTTSFQIQQLFIEQILFIPSPFHKHHTRLYPHYFIFPSTLQRWKYYLEIEVQKSIVTYLYLHSKLVSKIRPKYQMKVFLQHNPASLDD